MTEERIYRLAHTELLSIWGKVKDQLERMPENSFTQARERKAWNELEELEKMAAEKGINI